MELAPKERKCYYDETGMEIRAGDLLQIYHFRHYRRRQKMYMYHIAILQENPDGLWWAGKEYNRTENKGHYWLFAVANKETGIIRGTRIISHSGDGWKQADRLKKEAKIRLKQLQCQITI